MTTDDGYIGQRLAHYRDLAGLSQDDLAEAMGWTQPYVSMIERGRRAVTKRATILRLSEILKVPNAALLGIPLPASTKEDLITLSAVAGIRAALDYPDEPIIPRPQHELEALTRAVVSARMECDYGVIGAGLPAQLAEARAAWEAGHRWAGILFVRGLVVGSLTLRPVGWQDLAMRLAEMARRAAIAVDDSEAIGAAEFAYAQGLLSDGARRRSMDFATTAADMAPSVGVWRGMLNLQAALAASSLGDGGRALDHFAEAEELARRNDRPDPWLMEFTPANVGTWRVAGALEVPDNGDAGHAPELARMVDRSALVTRQRISRLDMDAGRGLYLSGQTEPAIRAFLRAYDVAPVETRARTSVREIVLQMKRDARGGGPAILRELIDAMGVAA